MTRDEHNQADLGQRRDGSGAERAGAAAARPPPSAQRAVRRVADDLNVIHQLTCCKSAES